jgi:hypothetical protein
MNKEPYKVGIIGHRDLLPTQKEENIQILKGHLLKLKREHSDKELVVVTPLAEGADRLLVYVAGMLGISYEVVLPMEKSLYMMDFSKLSRLEFEKLLKGAKSVRVIELYAGNTNRLIKENSIYRSFQYRQVGREIVDSCDEMIIMSDGIQNQKMGGTEDIANYAKLYDKIMYKIPCQRANGSDASASP